MKFSIVGSGIAGLSLGYEAIKKGHQVEILDKLPFHGGLCRSFEKNDCNLDIGVHLFHGRDPEVMQIAREVVDDDKWIKVKRNGKLFIRGKHVTWPLKVVSGFQLPIGLTFEILKDQIFGKKPNKSQNGSVSNYKSEILSVYGETLFNELFGPLTEKFFQLNTEEIHADWAFSSIRSATKIEDKNFKDSYKYLIEDTSEQSKKSFNLFRFTANQLANSLKEEDFYYFTDGYGTLADSYVQKIQNLGGQVSLNSPIEDIEIKDNTVVGLKINGDVVETDKLVWTGDMESLSKTLGIKVPKVKRLHSKFVYVFLNSSLKKHQVCYYADRDISFVRGTILSNHYKGIIKNANVKSVVCLEYTSTSPFAEREPKLSGSEMDTLLRDLKKVGLIKRDKEIEDIYTLTVPSTYPIFTTEYREEISKVKTQLREIKNLSVFGRQGAFTYENADVLMKEAKYHSVFSL